MRNLICAIILVSFMNCTNKKHYIIIPNLKGKIYSKVDNKPIKGIAIFVSKFSVNFLTDSVKTDKNGFFFYNGIFVYSYDNMRRLSPMVQEGFYLKNDKLYKYLDVRKYYYNKYYNKDEFHKKDTIDLGVIYFEDLKSIRKDSITE